VDDFVAEKRGPLTGGEVRAFVNGLVFGGRMGKIMTAMRTLSGIDTFIINADLPDPSPDREAACRNVAGCELAPGVARPGDFNGPRPGGPNPNRFRDHLIGLIASAALNAKSATIPVAPTDAGSSDGRKTGELIVSNVTMDDAAKMLSGLGYRPDPERPGQWVKEAVEKAEEVQGEWTERPGGGASRETGPNNFAPGDAGPVRVSDEPSDPANRASREAGEIASDIAKETVGAG
jgi:hypothetical protein